MKTAFAALLVPLFAALPVRADVITTCSYVTDATVRAAEVFKTTPKDCAALADPVTMAITAVPPGCPNGYRQYGPVQTVDLSETPLVRWFGGSPNVSVRRTFSEARRTCLAPDHTEEALTRSKEALDRAKDALERANHANESVQVVEKRLRARTSTEVKQAEP